MVSSKKTNKPARYWAGKEQQGKEFCSSSDESEKIRPTPFPPPPSKHSAVDEDGDGEFIFEPSSRLPRHVNRGGRGDTERKGKEKENDLDHHQPTTVGSTTRRRITTAKILHVGTPGGKIEGQGQEMATQEADESDVDSIDRRRQRAKERARARIQQQKDMNQTLDHAEDEFGDELCEVLDDAAQDSDNPFLEYKQGQNDDLENDLDLVRKKISSKESLQDSDEESENNSEYSDDDESEDEDEEDDISMPKFIKPVFVPKEQRKTKLDLEKLKEEDEKLEQEKVKKEEERKLESKAIVSNSVKADIEREQLDQEDFDSLGLQLPDDTDRPEEQKHGIEQWKAREFDRVKKERITDQDLQREKEETERRRNMTEEEKRAEDQKRLDRDAEARKNKVKMVYLQRYYHRGAFFMEEDDEGKLNEELYNRNFNAPTEEDRVDKTMLPVPMQLRRGQVGMKGQTKYTHLVDQDTTFGKNNDQYHRTVQLKNQEILPRASFARQSKIWERNLGGLKAKDSFEKPRGMKKNK